MLFRARQAAVLLTATLLSATTLAACGGSTPQGTRYVALGDSAVAGAGIKPSTAGTCPRSTNNYPSLVARSFGVKTFVDVSCPGATTHDIIQEMNHDGLAASAQIDSVTPDTDVVTISIGGNDGDVIPGLFLSCYIPPTNTSKACRASTKAIPRELRTTRTQVVRILERIKKRAPHALVVLVGYLRVMPDSGSCKAVPISNANLEIAAAAEGELEDMLKASAGQANVPYVSMRGRSVGHDACAAKDKSWVSALKPEAGDGTFLHPRAVGMEAVAKAVEPAVGSRLGD